MTEKPVQRSITSLKLTNFRNYETFDLEPDVNLTVLVGPNGVGKTNVIEAVSLVTRGESFRTNVWNDVVRWGAERAYVSMTADEKLGGRTDVALEVSGGRRLYRVNGSVKRRVSDVPRNVPAVVFTPEDLTVVKGAADKRRGALDSLGTQLSAAYASTRVEYERIARQRNALLKTPEIPVSEISPWTERLVHVGARLREQRLRLLARMRIEIEAVYSALTGGEALSLSYIVRDREEPETVKPGLGDGVDAESIARRMTEASSLRAQEERARGTSLIGPHRDDITFVLEGKDARVFASQGQQRTIALAWKLAEVNAIEEIAQATPVLLLDDVMSELDESRRHKLTTFVTQRTQTFVTTTNIGYFDPDFVSAAKIVELT